MAKKKIGKARKKPLKSYEVGVNVHYSSFYIVEALKMKKRLERRL